MTYVIGGACIDVMDKSCLDVCPVDCIYEGGRKLYVQPDECVDCGACEPECPVDAVVYQDDLAEADLVHLADNARFFTETLPGRDAPLGGPGSGQNLGRIGVDTELVTDAPPKADS
jgi:NAD-dependent dihydropyrimidine dehydrogenase PreA subunit